ncbi:glycosyltransferase [Pilimelia columellifera]
MRDRADLALINVTDDLQPDRAGFSDRFRFVGPLLRPDEHTDVDLPWEQLSAGPVLFVSFGTVYQRSTDLYRRIAEAFRETDWTVVMATARTDPALLGPLPPNVYAHRFVPQHRVLQHSDVFITHAGMNSVLDAVMCRVPMLTLPSSLDQKGVAEHLSSLGIGSTFHSGLSAEEIRAAVHQLAGDAALKSRLDQLADAMPEPAIAAANAADALEDLVRERRRGIAAPA